MIAYGFLHKREAFYNQFIQRKRRNSFPLYVKDYKWRIDAINTIEQSAEADRTREIKPEEKSPALTE